MLLTGYHPPKLKLSKVRSAHFGSSDDVDTGGSTKIAGYTRRHTFLDVNSRPDSRLDSSKYNEQTSALYP